MSPAPSGLVKAVQAHARDRPDDIALVFLGPDGEEAERLSFGALDARARAVAATLRVNVPNGGHVMLPIQPTARSVVVLCGCLYAGRPCAPVPTPGLNGSLDRLAAMARASRASAAIAPDGTDPLRATAPDIAWLSASGIAEAGEARDGLEAVTPAGDEVALLQFTSGSTRDPKAVELTHDNVTANLEMLRIAFRAGRESRFASWLPLFHDMGLALVLMPLYFGATGVLMPPLAFVRRPARWLRMASDHRATIIGAPNFAFELCLQRVTAAEAAGLDLSACDIAFCGAEPVQMSTMAAFASRFAAQGLRASAMYPCYGLAEAVCYVSGGRLFDRAPSIMPVGGAAPCGRASGELHIEIVDPSTGCFLPAEEVGEVWIKGPSVGRGYLGLERETAASFAAVTADGRGGWLRTGDLGRLDAEGRLVLLGRLKDVLIHRGANIQALDLEAEVSDSHPGFSDTGAAFSVPAASEEGAVVVQEAARGVVIEDGLAMAQAAMDAVAAAYGVKLHDLVLVRPGSLPKTTSGKVRRGAARDLYLAGAFPNLLGGPGVRKV